MHRDNLMDIYLNGKYQKEKTKDKESHAKVPIKISARTLEHTVKGHKLNKSTTTISRMY